MFQKASRRKRLLLRLGLYGGLLFVGLPLAFARVLTQTFPLQSPAPPPAGYELVAVKSDQLSLRAWLSAAADPGAGVVIVHGLGDSIEPYEGHASFFRRRGLSVILLDLRGHGGSEGWVGTVGAREADDVGAAMQALRDRGLADEGLILMGHSMGAVAVLRAAARADDVVAVVVEAPYDNLRSIVAHHAWLEFKLPAWVPIIPLAIGAAEWVGGFDADEVDAVAAASQIRAPILAIADEADPQMPPSTVRRVCAAAPACELWVAPGVGHLGAVQRAEYWPTVEGFLAKNGL